MIDERQIAACLGVLVTSIFLSLLLLIVAVIFWAAEEHGVGNGLAMAVVAQSFMAIGAGVRYRQLVR